MRGVNILYWTIPGVLVMILGMFLINQTPWILYVSTAYLILYTIYLFIMNFTGRW